MKPSPGGAPAKPRYATFGRDLRKFLSVHASLGHGLYRWFRDEVGEDRYLRRWMRGDHLPSPENWRTFTAALMKRAPISQAFDQQLRELEESLNRLRFQDSSEAGKNRYDAENLYGEAERGELSELSGHGLVTLSQFRDEYWEKRRMDPGLARLWADPARAQLLMRALAGRSKEVAAFESLLNTSSLWVQFWKGWPGTGKSRLMIDFAERATSHGFRVLFVSPDVHDLRASLLRVKGSNPLLLIWDDYRGEQPHALRAFLELQRAPADPQGPIIKRLITSWPSHNVLGEKSREPQYVEHELKPVEPHSELSQYARRLVIDLEEEAADHLVLLAEGHPEAVLRALSLLLDGVDIDRLPANLLEAAYDDLIRRVLRGLAQSERPAARRALVVLALIGSVDLSRPSARFSLQQAGVADELLGALLECRTITRRADEVYSLQPDGFRRHVIRRCLDHSHIDVLSGTPAEVAELARPFIAEHVDAIWPICLWATEDEERPSSLHRCLVALIDNAIHKLPEHQAADTAIRLAVAASTEPETEHKQLLVEQIRGILQRHDNPAVALATAHALLDLATQDADGGRRDQTIDAIGALLAQHDTESIALAYAYALADETGRTDDSERCRGLVERIRPMVVQYHTPIMAFLLARSLAFLGTLEASRHRWIELAAEIERLALSHDVYEIAFWAAYALSEIPLAGARSELSFRHRSERCEWPADHIAILLTRHGSERIAGLLARALSRAALVEPEPRRVMPLANRIRDLRLRYGTPEIAEAEAAVLAQATIEPRDLNLCEGAVRRISALLKHQDSVVIARFLASALGSAAEVCEGNPAACRRFERRIAALLEQYDDSEIAAHQVLALRSTSVGESDPDRQQILLGRMEHLYERYQTQHIAASLAAALADTVSLGPTARRRGATAKIDKLLVRHPVLEIARVQARAFVEAAGVAGDQQERREYVVAVERLRDQFDQPIIAQALAHALAHVAAGANDRAEFEACVAKIEGLLLSVDTQPIAHLLAVTLENGTIKIDYAPHEREAAAHRIGALLARFDIPEIASAQANALANATIRAPDPRHRVALADQIGHLLARHDIEDIACSQARALYHGVFGETDVARCEGLAVRLRALLARYKAKEIATFLVALLEYLQRGLANGSPEWKACTGEIHSLRLRYRL